MSLVINHNSMSSNVARNLNVHYGKLSTSTQRLSTGLRVNSAADDAAGLAIRELQRADIATLRQGARNANDAISMIQTADGALQIIDEKLIRMKELAEQAATGTYDSTQRLMIDSEFQAMASEIDRIANATDFNGIHLLNGNLSGAHNGAGLNSTGAMKIHFGTGNDAAEDYYYIDIGDCRVEGLFNTHDAISDNINIYGYNTHTGRDIIGVDFNVINQRFSGFDSYDFTMAYKVGPTHIVSSVDYTLGVPRNNSDTSPHCWVELGSPDVVNHDFSGYEVRYTQSTDMWEITNGDPDFPDARINAHSNGCAINLDGRGGGDLYIHFNRELNEDTTISFNLYEEYGIPKNNTGYSSMKVNELPPNGNNKRFSIDFDDNLDGDVIGEVITEGSGSTYNFVIEFGKGTNNAGAFTLSTQSSAQKMLNKIDNAIANKDKIRAHLGALQNRLENTISNLNIQAENLLAAESRISDVDVATEMTEFVREQILTQASVAMLSQANSMPKMAMQLIGG